MAIATSDLTNGSISTNTDNEYQWTGTGIFDKLIEVVNNNIKVQYDNGRIKEDAYAEVYLGSIQTVIAQSMQFLLNKDKIDKEIELVTAQIAKVNADKLLVDAQKSELALNGTADRALKGSQAAKVDYEKNFVLPQQVANLVAQESLYTRQEAGFDDNANQKALDSLVNAWTLAYSSGMMDATNTLSSVSDAKIAELVSKVTY